MNAATRRYIAIETAISIAINVVLSIGFALLVFGRRAMVDLGGRDVLLDMLPQSFMIAFMATLVPTLLTRRRLRAGSIAPLPGGPKLPGNPVLRALVMGIAAAAIGTGLFALVQPQMVAATSVFIVAKAGYGALLALLVTPLGLRAALSDPVRSNRG